MTRDKAAVTLVFVSLFRYLKQKSIYVPRTLYSQGPMFQGICVVIWENSISVLKI